MGNISGPITGRMILDALRLVKPPGGINVAICHRAVPPRILKEVGKALQSLERVYLTLNGETMAFNYFCPGDEGAWGTIELVTSQGGLSLPIEFREGEFVPTPITEETAKFLAAIRTSAKSERCGKASQKYLRSLDNYQMTRRGFFQGKKKAEETQEFLKTIDNDQLGTIKQETRTRRKEARRLLGLLNNLMESEDMPKEPPEWFPSSLADNIYKGYRPAINSKYRKGGKGWGKYGTTKEGKRRVAKSELQVSLIHHLQNELHICPENCWGTRVGIWNSPTYKHYHEEEDAPRRIAHWCCRWRVVIEAKKSIHDSKMQRKRNLLELLRLRRVVKQNKQMLELVQRKEESKQKGGTHNDE